ncbi:MAG TPA: lipopolysaccharide biosynthesis protein [Terriglobia bacterium]|nr:lipopolysaccharide biosynthesis protein [Terriglobia bacterium]
MRPFNAEGKFHPVTKGERQLRCLAVRGAGAAVSAQGLSLGIQMIATVVLARLLTPSDFGVVTMVTTVSLLIMNFGLNGFTEAVVQIEEITHTLASNLFWINVGASLLLTIGFASAGSLLSWFYRDPRVASVTIGVSLTILVTGVSVLHLALLKRAMEFPGIAANDVLARAASVVTSITLALLGCGYWALVAGVVALPLSTAVGSWVLCRWTPSLPRRVPGTAKLVRYAINVYGHFAANYFARNTDNVLVGWRFGARSLGFYKKAYDLFALSSSQLVSPITGVAVSALSRLKNDTLQYRRYLLRALALLAFVALGVGANLSLVGKDLIRVILGPGWEESGRIFVFFGPGIGVMLLYYTHGWIHLSIGTPDRWFRWGIIELLVTGTLFLVGLPWGGVGIAMAWTVSFWILMLPAFWYAGKPIGFGVGPVVGVIWRYIVAAILATSASLMVLFHAHPYGPGTGMGEALARMVTVSVLFWTFYLVAVVALYRSIDPIYYVLKLLPDMLPFLRSRKLEHPAFDPKDERCADSTLQMTSEEILESSGR